MINATKESIEANGGSMDLPIAFDGTWQKRAFISKNGCTVTSIDIGKVLNVEVLSK